MQLTTILLLGLSLSLSATTLSQNVSFTAKNAPLEKAFAAIEAQTGYFVTFNARDIEHATVRNVTADHLPLEDFLQLILREQPLDFSIEGKTIFVKKKEERPVHVDDILGDEPPLKGRVTDAEGNPVSGVSVAIKGTNIGTTTDGYGNFELEVREGQIVVLSSVEFETREIKVGKGNSINISLNRSVASLNEVVVNKGYYSERKKLSTASISKVSSPDIERQPVTNPLMALQGRVPGLDIAPVSGVAGGAINIQIRGRNSLRPNASFPLYIIDGIPIDSRPVESSNEGLLGEKGFDPLSTINPANIESIEVLKDADATAIYGSRGANGVILITTKKGNQSEKTNVDINAYFGSQKIPQFVDVLNTQQYVAMRNEAYANAGLTPSGNRARDLLRWDTTRYTDWQKELLGRSANISDVQANVSSGNRYTSFRFGVAYHKEGSIFGKDFNFQRASGHFSLNHNSSNGKFQAALTTNYGVEENKLFEGANPVQLSQTLAPNAPALYDSTGKLNWENSTWTNPLADRYKTDNNKGNNIVVNGTLSYYILKGVQVKTRLGYNALNRDAFTKEDPFSAMDPDDITAGVTATSSFGRTERNSWIVEPQISYDKKFKQHTLNIIAGSSFQQSHSAYQLLEAAGYASEIQMSSLQAATGIRSLKDEDSEYGYVAVYGRIGYNYKEKYLLNLTARRDGSSRFGSGKQYGNFGAIGAGWLFTNESFMSAIPWLSYGKIRGSYGTTGSDQIGDHQYLSTYTFLPYTYQGQVSLIPSGLSNPDYAWEETKKLEGALELGLFRDRINIEAALYRNRCSNQLLNFDLQGAAGFPGVISNLPATVENSGFELSLVSANIKNRDFKWTTSFNISIPKNKLVAYPGLEVSPYANQYVIGKSINITKSFAFQGVNPETGLYEIEDVNNDGNYDTEDMISIVNLDRKYYGGMNNHFGFKGFDLSVLFQFSEQMVFRGSIPRAGYDIGNVPVEFYEQRWQKVGDIAAYQKISRNGEVTLPQLNASASDYTHVNSRFLRLKTLSISYSLPYTLLQKMSLRMLKIYVQGQNLWTTSNNNLLDPETGFNVPPSRMITAGVQINL